MALLRVTTGDDRWAGVETDAIGAVRSLEGTDPARLPPPTGPT